METTERPERGMATVSKDAKMSIPTPIELFIEGERILAEQHAAKEHEKVGVFRGGSAGCILPDHTYIGDLYKDMARFLGMQRGILMGSYMDAGIANEYIWEKNIAATKTPFRCEEKIPVRYEFDNKYVATGRPDMVVGIENKVMEITEFTPVYGIELKTKNTVKTAASSLLGGKIDPKHLCQAGLYMHALNIPFYLVNTSMTGGELGYFDKKEYDAWEVSPGKNQYLLSWRDGCLFVDDVKTIITLEGILDYYRIIGEMVDRQEIVSLRNSSCDAVGKSLPYDLNDYMDFPLAVSCGQSFKDWVQEAESYCKVPAEYSIKYKTKKGSGWYEVHYTTYKLQGNTLYTVVEDVSRFQGLEEARKYLHSLSEG